MELIVSKVLGKVPKAFVQPAKDAQLGKQGQDSAQLFLVFGGANGMCYAFVIDISRQDISLFDKVLKSDGRLRVKKTRTR